MKTDLPVLLDPQLLAEQGDRFSGRIAISAMPRVHAIAVSDDTELQVKLEFGFSKHGHPLLTGTIVGGLSAHCERCLQPVFISINEAFELVMVQEDSPYQTRLLQEYDVVEFSHSIHLMELLEDQVLLSLPLVVKHVSLQDCDPAVLKWMQDGEEFNKQMAKPNPFAVLKDQD